LPSKSKQKIENRVSSCWKATQTRLPSVTGVELAKLFRPCFISLGVVMTTFSQRRAPSFALRQRSFRSPLFSRHVVTKIRSPQTTGDEWPLPGSGIFQRTFSVALHLTGKPVSSDVPSRLGPRQPDHSSGPAWASVPSARRRTKTLMLMREALPYGPITPGREGESQLTQSVRSNANGGHFLASGARCGERDVARGLHCSQYGIAEGPPRRAAPVVRAVQP